MATLKQLLEIGTAKLQEYHIEDAKTDAWILFVSHREKMQSLSDSIYYRKADVYGT